LSSMANSRAIARLISEFGRERFAFWRLRPER
jgi:hypothetical protein